MSFLLRLGKRRDLCPSAMAASLRKLVSSSSPPLRILTSAFRDPAATLPSRPSQTYPDEEIAPHHLGSSVSPGCRLNQCSAEPGKENREDTLLGSIPFQVYYPCFPFVHRVNPVFIPGSVPSSSDDGDIGRETTVWADSVKKKRKKKMNKHKYKKLRKRLRRQT